jgi:hypothetical protein
VNKIVQAEDILALARNYVEYVFMAAAGGSLPINSTKQSFLLDEVNKINALREENEALRGGLAAAGLVHSAKPKESKPKRRRASLKFTTHKAALPMCSILRIHIKVPQPHFVILRDI